MSIFSWDRKRGIMNITKHYFYKGSLRVNEHFQYFTYLLSFKVFKYLWAQMKYASFLPKSQAGPRNWSLGKTLSWRSMTVNFYLC